MPIYIPNLIVLAFRLPELLDRAARRHEFLFALSCAALAWLTLELATPVGPLWGERPSADPQGHAVTCGILLVMGLIIATACITKDRRYIKEAWLVSLTAYCLFLGITTGLEYAAVCGIIALMSSTPTYFISTTVAKLIFCDTTA